MNKKILSIFILFFGITLQPRVHAGGIAGAIGEAFFHHLAEGAENTDGAITCIACAVALGGVTACIVGCINKINNKKKRELLQKIEQYCQNNKINPSDLSHDDVVAFVQNLKKEPLLRKIIKKNETLTKLKRKFLWDNLLFYGGMVSIVAAYIGWELSQVKPFEFNHYVLPQGPPVGPSSLRTYKI